MLVCALAEACPCSPGCRSAKITRINPTEVGKAAGEQIPYSEPEEMHPRQQTRNIPNKNKQPVNTSKIETSNYTKHNCKRQSTEHCLTTNKKCRKAYTHRQKPERSEGIKHIPPFNPEVRGMLATSSARRSEEQVPAGRSLLRRRPAYAIGLLSVVSLCGCLLAF